MDGEKSRSRDQFARTQLLLGQEAMERLYQKRVAVFGIGGVGGYVCEALVRSGIGAFDLIDSDTVSLTNLNRQIIATRKTLGQYNLRKVNAVHKSTCSYFRYTLFDNKLFNVIGIGHPRKPLQFPG